jgi:hypothetical protein
MKMMLGRSAAEAMLGSSKKRMEINIRMVILCKSSTVLTYYS